MQRVRTITHRWPVDSDEARTALEPRDDLLRETEGCTVGEVVEFGQAHGPLQAYRRTVCADGDHVIERIEYRFCLPWFRPLLAPLVRRAVAHRRPAGSTSQWWAPPDQLTARQAHTLALLALASMAAAFANTLFTQTSTFAAEAFAAGDGALGVAGAVVRLGIVIALPFAFIADRVGRRRTIVLLAWLTPLCCALGALVPSFPLLVATQTVGRPLGIALSLLAGVAAAEEMPRNSRAYALSVLAMSAGLGAGVCVAGLALADVGDEGWRLVYLMSLVWMPVAVSLTRHLHETRRFETAHRVAPPMHRGRLGLIAVVALASNLFVAPASYFQNDYLRIERFFSAGDITVFTLLTGTPASIGLLLGGRLSDVIGRRRVIIWCTPLSAVALALAFSTSGVLMWAATLLGGLTAAMAFPAFAVYRAELFPTGSRGSANGIITTTALLAGSLGIVVVGVLRDQGMSYGQVIGIVALGQIIAALIAYRWYPETAHLELEQLNPEDPAVAVE